MKIILLLIVFATVLVAGAPGKNDKVAEVAPPVGGKIAPAASNTAVAASPPRPFYECDTKLDNPKYYNESCTNNTECFGGNDNSMVCKSGICTCNDLFVVEERFLGEAAAQKICVSAPYLFAPCVTICQKPFVCKTVDGSTSKACQCDAPYKLVDSVCFLECKDGEIYDQTVFKCVPKCKANEVKINSTCKPQADVGSACEINLQCVAAYSECKDKKCACRSGFTLKQGACVSDNVSCPSGEALKSAAGDYQKCVLTSAPVDEKKPPPPPVQQLSAQGGVSAKLALPFTPVSSNELRDSCPSTHFCLITGGEYYVAKADGICCPKLKVTCPFGNPSTKHSCSPGPNGEYCPYETHYCYGLNIGSSSDRLVCCPKECPTNTVPLNGKCLPQAGLNEACTVDKQCTDNNSGCVNGFCKCTNGSTESGSTIFKYCTRDCKEGETLFNSQCYSILSLGDSCEGQDWRCPTNAYCNSKKVCACQCGMFTLSKDLCAPAPSCPRPQFITPLFASAEAKGAGTPPAAITEEKKKELLKNVTFCIGKDKKVPTDVKTGACAKTQYCAYYLQNLGICCTKPEPKCPDGSKPISDKTCDPTNPLSCGAESNCYTYLSPADPDSKDGRICCKSFQFNPDPLPPQ